MSKVLVAYFSASGVTAKTAQKLAKAAKGDLFEIKPEKPYSSADLNWNDKNSRSSVEMNDRSSRPAIASKTDISGYDVIFVGFPIWWYREPSIIDTFIEEYDFGGKTVIPFATSGGSGLGESAKNLRGLAPSANVLEGRKLSAMVTETELEDWIKTLY